MTHPLFRLSPQVSQNLAPSPTLHINERVQALWAANRPVYHLGFGESRLPVHPKLREALRANAGQRSYLAGQGLAELRDQIAAYLELAGGIGCSLRPARRRFLYVPEF